LKPPYVFGIGIFPRKTGSSPAFTKHAPVRDPAILELMSLNSTSIASSVFQTFESEEGRQYVDKSWIK
jgi:hypothetical protein